MASRRSRDEEEFVGVEQGTTQGRDVVLAGEGNRVIRFVRCWGTQEDKLPGVVDLRVKVGAGLDDQARGEPVGLGENEPAIDVDKRSACG